MKITAVIPTYNEAENIGKMIEALKDERSLLPHDDLEILVVDGNSPDGTSDVVKRKMEQYPWVHLLVEHQKAGLGAAYVSGFRKAMHEFNADYVIEMDADFQHDPKDVKRLINKAHEGYDYVIGSRFTRGGGIPKEWGFMRKFWSIGGNIFAKLVLGIPEVNDFTSGFKISRVPGFVNKLPLDSIMTKGFAYKIDLLFKMSRLKAKIAEIPIQFGLRDRGTSKMENNNAADSLRVVVMLRFNENKKFFKFIIVGFTGLFVDTLGFNILRILLRDSSLAAWLSGFIAMLVTFTLNNYWSFSESKIKGIDKKVKGFVIYIVSSMVPILIRGKLVMFATQNFGDTFLISNMAFFIGIVFGLIWNYTVYSKIIWKDTK
jgi:dolichol-phosphate mannosyltransferase